MGVVDNVGFDKFPNQTGWSGKRVEVCFNYDLSNTIRGTLIRDDLGEPFVGIIMLDDGRPVLTTECQYNLLKKEDLQREQFYGYEGDGLYYVGEYGLICSNDLDQLTDDLEEDYENEDAQVEYNLDYEVGEGAYIWLTKLSQADCGGHELFENEDIFEIQVLKRGNKVAWDTIELEGDELGWGTDHSVFGSGNVKLIHKA